MYPEPHIPSARTDRPLSEDCQPSNLPIRTLFVSGGSVLLFVTALSISVTRQVNLQCEQDDPAEIEARLVTTDPPEEKRELRFSTRTHSTRLP